MSELSDHVVTFEAAAESHARNRRRRIVSLAVEIGVLAGSIPAVWLLSRVVAPGLLAAVLFAGSFAVLGVALRSRGRFRTASSFGRISAVTAGLGLWMLLAAVLPGAPWWWAAPAAAALALRIYPGVPGAASEGSRCWMVIAAFACLALFLMTTMLWTGGTIR